MRALGVGVAQRLLAWGAGRPLILAGLLHEPVVAGWLTPKEVEAACGVDAALLCHDYAAHLAAPPPAGWHGHAAALRRVRVYAAAHQNPELALLAVAHMWHSVAFARGAAGGVGRRPPATSLALAADEVQTVLQPLLDMLGLREVRDQLDAFPGADWSPGAERGGETTGRAPLQSIAPIAAALDERLATLGNVQVIVRDASFAAGDRHGMERAGDQADKGSERGDRVQQSFAVQLLAPSVEACYLALRLLHHLYRPIEGTFFDTVALCRANGHRSLQTAVVAPVDGFGARLHVEIATPAMDRVNRWGVAAFLFEQHRLALGDEILDPAWDGAWWVANETRAAAINAAPLGSLPESVIVFSPLGEPFAFERGSTVVDFAYGVHSDLAEQCERFVVNGETVEPATVLHHLDLVTLVHNPRAAGPTQVWLNAARTKKARTRIRRFLRRQSEGINDGQRIVEGRLQALEGFYGFHVPDHRVAEAIARGARHARLNTPDDLLAEIAAGRAHADRYLHPLFAEEITRRLDLPRALKLRPHQVQMAQCCRPRPGDAIAGLPYVRNEQLQRLTVHKSDCPRFKALPAEIRAEAVALSWRLRAASRILVQVEVTARSDDRLMGEALAQVYAMIPAVRLFRTDAVARRGTARLRFALEADSDETVDEVVDRLRRLPNREISQVRKLALPPSEVELLAADTSPASNPYSRMPVHDPTMFFGRVAELQRINEWLHNNVSCIWLRGQKRVGKTSLMLHLRNHFWEPHEAICAFVDFQLLNNLAQANVFYEVARAIFTDLEKDPRAVSVGPPDRAAFEADPPGRLLAYLRAMHQRLGARRLVLLLDEFSRVSDLYLQGQMGGDFFSQWRGLLMAAERFCTFITVMQQKTYETLRAQHDAQMDNPCWQLQELGEELQLRPMDADSARRLVEWPMQNFVGFEPGAIDLVVDLTGGSPFLIQSFCNRLVTHLARTNSSSVRVEDVNEVAEEFMLPSENVFAHLLDLTPDVGLHMLVLLAQLASGQACDGHPTRTGGAIRLEALQAAKPNADPSTLRAILGRLAANDLLQHDAPGVWRFNSTLFQRWLARNA
jgi:(p)ppGpp synthase/HD superfamily hydrolase